MQNVQISDTSSLELGFVDKFVEVFRLRNKLDKISAEITEKKWSQQWSFMWGYELYNKTVLYANLMFEKLFYQLWKNEQNKTESEAPHIW